jgi:hypothetical protein
METQVSNGSEHMSEHPTEGVFSFSTLDGKLFRYEKYTEEQLQEFAVLFPTEIFFVLTGMEVEMITDVDMLVDVTGEEKDNLKEDFIYFHPTINGASWWECTCNNFLETDQKGEDRMLKRVVAHARKTGHTINPRGN